MSVWADNNRSFLRMFTITATLRYDYVWCKATNLWYSVDAHFQDGVGSMSHSVLIMKEANTSIVTNNDKLTLYLPGIINQKLLALRWHSFSWWGKEYVAYASPYTVCPCIDDVEPEPSYILNPGLTRPMIVDAPSTYSFTRLFAKSLLALWLINAANMFNMHESTQCSDS